MLGALSTGHEIGLAVVGGIFIAFALVCSFVIPRRNPDFPGEHGMPVFIIAALALFAAMITAVAVFGAESHEAAGATTEHAAPAAAKTIDVSESEFKVSLPAEQTLTPGKVVFNVTNDGKIEHDLAIEGPGMSGTVKTPLLKPGESAKLTVTLGAGTFALYCTVPGHREAGMLAKITVG